jgi:hypothetical protein
LHIVGSQPASSSGAGTAATAAATITGAKGGNTTSATGHTAGAGAVVTITSGAGGDAGGTGANTAGAGGAVNVAAGAGGAASTTTAVPGAGGSVTINSGTGGAGTGGTTGNGAGGAITIAAGAGGTGGGTAGGAGGAITLQGGSGGASSNGNGGNVVLQGGAKAGTGTEGSVIVKPQNNNGAAFLVQNAAGTSILAISTLTTGVTSNKLMLGNGTATLGASTSGGLFVTDSSEFLGQILIGAAANGVAVDATNHQMRFTGTAQNDIEIKLSPEFNGATFMPDGINNVGYLTSGFCSNVTGGLQVLTALCATNTAHSYYAWTTAEATPAQDYDTYVRYELPSDFDKFAASDTIKLYGRRDTSSDIVAYSVYQANGTQCGSTTTVTTTDDTWQEVALTGDETGCTFTAGDIITFKITTTAMNNGTAWIGELRFTYKSKF